MKTIEQVKRKYPDRVAEIDAVIEQFGDNEYWEEIATDIAAHGADAGWTGFTYYVDTVPFAQAHRQLILARLLADCEDFGEGKTPAQMVQGFRCLGGNFTTHEINSCLYTGRTDDMDAKTQILNALAWYLLEDVARLFED